MAGIPSRTRHLYLWCGCLVVLFGSWAYSTEEERGADASAPARTELTGTGQGSEVIFHLKTKRDLESLVRLWGTGGFSLDESVFKENGFSLRMEGKPSNAYRTRFVPYLPGEKVRVAGYVKSENITGSKSTLTPVASINFYDKNMESMGHTDVILVPNGEGDWQAVDGTDGPFSETVKFWSVILASGYLEAGTVWFNDLKVERIAKEMETEWRPMLLSSSFAIDEFQKGDWRSLTRVDWVRKTPQDYVLGRSTDDPTLDWDGYKLAEDPANVSFDPQEVPQPAYGAQSLTCPH